MQTVGPVCTGDKIFVSVTCNNPPYFLAAGTQLHKPFYYQKTTQNNPFNLLAMWMQIMGSYKCIVKCSLFCKREKIKHLAMMDNGAYVTIIACFE